jgi:hypothetical protein
MMLIKPDLRRFLTHVGHFANHRDSQRRFAPTLPRFTGIGAPLHRNTQNPDENAPIGLILCSEHDTAVAHYALGNLGNQVLAREYQLTLPTEEQLARRIEAKRKELDR